MNILAAMSFMLYPCAPPRLFPELGYNDMLKDLGKTDVYTGTRRWVNPYAAMPSMRILSPLSPPLFSCSPSPSRWSPFPFCPPLLFSLTPSRPRIFTSVCNNNNYYAPLGDPCTGLRRRARRIRRRCRIGTRSQTTKFPIGPALISWCAAHALPAVPCAVLLHAQQLTQAVLHFAPPPCVLGLPHVHVRGHRRNGQPLRTRRNRRRMRNGPRCATLPRDPAHHPLRAQRPCARRKVPAELHF